MLLSLCFPGSHAVPHPTNKPPDPKPAHSQKCYRVVKGKRVPIKCD